MKKYFAAVVLLILILACCRENGLVQIHRVDQQGLPGYVFVNHRPFGIREVFVGTNQIPSGYECTYREILLWNRRLGFADVSVSYNDFLSHLRHEQDKARDENRR